MMTVLKTVFQNKELLYQKLKGGPKRRKRVKRVPFLILFLRLTLLMINLTINQSTLLTLYVYICLFLQSTNPYLMGQRLDNVVAKKSVPHFSEEEEEEKTTTMEEVPDGSAADKSSS